MAYHCSLCHLGTIMNIHFEGQQLFGRCWACDREVQLVPGGGMFAKLVAVPPTATPQEELQHDAQG